MQLPNHVQLLAYPNRIGDNLADLATAIEALGDSIGGAHILPIYPSNADAGFSPLTHTEVDPAYGSWEDIRRISDTYTLCLDLILNHISDESPEYQDFLKHGFDSRYNDLFIHVGDAYPLNEAENNKIYSRKKDGPFLEVTCENGDETVLWCSFTKHQIDLNFESKQTYALMERYVDHLLDMGVKLIRLDAIGYVTKRIGTSCFCLEPEMYQVLDWFRERAAARGAAILPEAHDHYSFQHAFANRGVYGYSFALPPLVLHAFLSKQNRYLYNWLRQCPHKQITVLDTHDGIGMIDAEGALPDAEIDRLIKDLTPVSGEPIMEYHADCDGCERIYQMNATFFEAMHRDEDAYIAARTIQCFTPGIPQIYYVGLVAGTNTPELIDSGGDKREINRAYYRMDEWQQALSAPVSQRLQTLLTFRNTYPAFNGKYTPYTPDSDDEIIIGWHNDTYNCTATISLSNKTAYIEYTDLETQEEVTLQL